MKNVVLNARVPVAILLLYVEEEVIARRSSTRGDAVSESDAREREKHELESRSLGKDRHCDAIAKCVNVKMRRSSW